MNYSKTAAEFEAPRHLAATAGLPCRMSLNNPLVLQCRNCRRVLSDSNQLLCTIEALDGIVLDAVLGVRIGQEPLEAAGCKYVTLTCMTPDCGLEVGRCFTSAPPEISEAVQSDGKPRYVLHKAALQSYELGSTKQHHDAARGIAPEATQEGSREEALAHTANAAHTNGHHLDQPPEAFGAEGFAAQGFAAGSLAAEVEVLKARVSQLEPLQGETAAAKQRILQLMQLVLSVDERISKLERVQGEREPLAGGGLERGLAGGLDSGLDSGLTDGLDAAKRPRQR